MRFTESKKRTHWLIVSLLIVAMIGILSLGFCQFNPVPKTVQKTIVFEAD